MEHSLCKAFGLRVVADAMVTIYQNHALSKWIVKRMAQDDQIYNFFNFRFAEAGRIFSLTPSKKVARREHWRPLISNDLVGMSDMVIMFNLIIFLWVQCLPNIFSQVERAN